MRECQNCHKKVPWIIRIFDAGTQDFDPKEKIDLIGEPSQDWCLACVYREGNRELYRQYPPSTYVELDFKEIKTFDPSTGRTK